MARIPPSQRLAERAEELREQTDASDLVNELVRLGARKLVQELLEAEVTEALGRAPYQRRAGTGVTGYRNGYKTRHLDTAEGRLEIELPQVRATDTPFHSLLWGGMRRRTEVLEQLIVEMYVRGLSTRDIEDALADLAPGEEVLLGRSSVSRITDRLSEEYEQFCARDLTELDVVYLFADAVYEALRREASCKEGVLVTWAILADGSKVLLHMSAGSKESSESWLDHFRSLLSRGLNPPLTVTTDGAPGAIKAVEAIWPEAQRIRCWVHKMRNVLDKLPEADHAVVKPYLQAIRDAPDYATGRRLAEETIAQFEKTYPSAMKSLADDLEASLAHLQLPPVHRKAVRTTNLVERSFVEERRRTKVLPRFGSEGACTKLVHAVLWRASERWRRVTFSELERRQIEQYRRLRQAQKGQTKLAAATSVA